MKATQDNASWISNAYEQGSSEDNWALMGVKYRVPRFPLTISEASTTSLTVLTPTGNISASDPIELYNATDGSTSYAAVVSSTEYPNNIQKDLDITQSTVVYPHTYFDTTAEGRIAWNADGSRCFTLSGGGIIKEYSVPRDWDIKGASSEGPTLETTHTLDFGGESTPNYEDAAAIFADSGNYFYLMTAEWKYVYRWTLSTPYDLSTAGTIKVFNCGQANTDKWVTTLYASNTTDTVSQLAVGGFCGLGFSSDGLKGVFFRRDDIQASSSGMPNNLTWSFVLSKPYDLDTITSGQYNKLSFGTTTTNVLLHGQISPDGKIIYGFDSIENGNGSIRRISLTTPWEVNSGHTELVNTSISSSNYQSNNQYNYNAQLTISPDGNYVSFEGGRYYLFNYAAENSPYWPRTVLNITSASQTVAPTKALKSSENVSGISYQQLTRADVAKEDQALAVGSGSTGTSLQVYPSMDYQGSTALNSQTLNIDGTSFSTSTATHNDNFVSVGSSGSAVNPLTKGDDVGAEGRFVGLYNFDNPTDRGGVTPATYANPMGMAFSNDGKKFFVSGYGTVDFSTFGGPSSIHDAIVTWDLSTAWDISTASFNSAIDAGTLKGAPADPAMNYEGQDFAFNADGTKMFVLHSYSASGLGYLYEGTLSTPYDISTWTYSNHVELTGSTSLLNTDYLYSFAIAPDGKVAIFYSSTTTGSISSDSYTQSHYVSLSTPFDFSTATNKGVLSSLRHYRASLWGDETYGYTSFGVESANTGFRYNLMTCASISGDLSNKNAATDSALDMSDLENWTDSSIGTSSTRTGKTIVVDGGTKMYIHFPELHSVAMFTGPFGNFQDRYTIDISSLGLTGQPTDVRFDRNSTYTSLPTGSSTSTTDRYVEYTVADQSVNAEALRFKIEGDTDAEVSRFNVDLST